MVTAANLRHRPTSSGGSGGGSSLDVGSGDNNSNEYELSSSSSAGGAALSRLLSARRRLAALPSSFGNGGGTGATTAWSKFGFSALLPTSVVLLLLYRFNSLTLDAARPAAGRTSSDGFQYQRLTSTYVPVDGGGGGGSSGDSSDVDLLPIVLPTRHRYPYGVFHKPLKRAKRSSRPHYGSIKFVSLFEKKNDKNKKKRDKKSRDKAKRETPVFERRIRDDEVSAEKESVEIHRRKYDVERRFDSSDRYVHYDELDYPKASGCYRPKWSFDVFPNCNTFHEIELQPSSPPEPGSVAASANDRIVTNNLNVTFVGRGHFRQGWSVADGTTTKNGNGVDDDGFVLKTTRLRDDKDTFTTSGIAMTQVEAITMLQLSSSNRTTNMYVQVSFFLFLLDSKTAIN